MKKIILTLIFFAFSFIWANAYTWCTLPNALNYDPQATVNSWDCFYNSANNWNWESIFTLNFIEDYYTFFTWILITLTLILFFFSLIKFKN